MGNYCNLALKLSWRLGSGRVKTEKARKHNSKQVFQTVGSSLLRTVSNENAF